MERKPLNVKIPENIHNELEERGENKTKATAKALELYLWGGDSSEVKHLKERLADCKEENKFLKKIIEFFKGAIANLNEKHTEQLDKLYNEKQRTTHPKTVRLPPSMKRNKRNP